MKLREMKRENDVYIYAETAFAHEGDAEYLYSMVNEAANGGADAIKFQILLDINESYTSSIICSSKLFQWIINEQEWIQIIRYARDKGLEVVLLPIDMKALEFCISHQELYEILEIHSINFNHYYMLRKINEIEDKVISLGIGGRTLSDIEFAINILEKPYLEKRLLLMHGFQSFPTKPENLKMIMINRMKEMFKISVGYADHTAFDQDDTFLMQVAYINGARIFEKHIVIKQGEERTDYQAAVNGMHIVEIRKKLREISCIQGNASVFALNSAETKYRDREKKIVAIDEIVRGDILSEKNIGYKVTEEYTVYEQKDICKILGTISSEDYSTDSVIKQRIKDDE